MNKSSWRSYIRSGLVLCLFGCSMSQNTSTNLLFTVTSGNIIAYIETPIFPTPAYSVFKLQQPLVLMDDYADSVKLESFSDSSCKTASVGTLAVTSDPQPLTSGVATFSSVAYSLAKATIL